MHDEIHANLVLYKPSPIPGNRYRQIIVVESERFEVRILEGEVLRADPHFAANSEDAEVHIHLDIKSALDDADKEFNASVMSGWIPYPAL
jgi:hypothetical protein